MVRAHERTAQVNLCSQQELVRLDARLNKAYTELLRQSDPEHARDLKLEERRWIKKRDYDCKLDAGTTDNGCMLEQTSSRADELESHLKF
jgi:uncharacterized protein YecT (DUF1311 family)